MKLLAYSTVFILMIVSCKELKEPEEIPHKSNHHITALNKDEIPVGSKTIAIVGVSLIDGITEGPIENASVIIKDGFIIDVGKSDVVPIPKNAEIIDGKGHSIIPGLIDAHYHNSVGYPAIFLKRGITSLRDPGIWIEDYDNERKKGDPLPRLFLTGPHLDMPPPTYPNDCYAVRDEAEVKEALDYLISQHSTAVKVYFRLPLGLIKKACDIAHANGLPVTGHLEITDARQAILVGLDGIEHVTSLGTALIPRKKAEVYRQRIMDDSNERKPGRYEMWKDIDVNSKAADSLIKFLVAHQTYLTPTLGAFEYRIEGNNQDSTAFLGFQNMMAFIGRCHESDVNIVLGSHGPWNKYIETGWTYQHEMSLLAKTGMDNMKIIKAATILNARFFKIDDRLGSIEKGKQADLVLLSGNPIEDINAMYNVEKVMLNGVWVK